MDSDLALLATRSCDVVFAPDESEMYAPGHATYVEVGHIGTVLEGEFRPTHFRGVATIVLKLFQLASADSAYFGRKDYQQSLVVRQMVSDLNVPIDIRVRPIVREPDGLAMSSRNVNLSAAERQSALSLSRSLRLAENMVQSGKRDVETLRQAIRAELGSRPGVDVQYIAFLAEGTVVPVSTITGPTTIALAAKVGKTRLIDNTLVGCHEPSTE
jgi:pantoate--beta-alanine ligase